MHITGGKLRKRTVQVANTKTVRPTSAKVREAIFSMIGQNLEGVSMLDAFGGSGIMGLEAWSRGAHPVRITEKNAKNAAQIRQSVTLFKADIEVQCVDATKCLKGNWDLIFLDPPYKMKIEPYLEQALSVGQWVVIAETDLKSPPNLTAVATFNKEEWEVWKQKQYGASMITIFRRVVSSVE